MNKPAETPSNSGERKNPQRDARRYSKEEAERDRQLVAASKKNDKTAFNELVVRFRRRIYAMLVNMTHNEQDAWDLSQDTFVKAWKALPRFEGKSSFYTWIYRIAYNVGADWLRKKKLQSSTEFDDGISSTGRVEPGAPTVPQSAPSPSRALERRELRQRIEKAMKKLSPEHRAVILMKEMEGMSYQQIADALECSIGTVMSRLFYARKKLQSLLKDAKDAYGKS